MRKSLYYSFMTMLCAGLFYSCSDDDSSTPVIGIKEVKITPADEAISVSMTGRYNTFTLENTTDSVDVDVPKDALKNARMEVTTTVAANIQAFYNGELIDGPVTVDATQPIKVEVRGYNQSHLYTLNVVQATSIAKGTEPRLKSTDMRLMGINTNAYDFDVTLFNNKFYAISAAKTGDLAEYQLYVSDNGVKWNEVAYNCVDADNNPCSIGGRGARLIVWNNRLYILGGGRYDGTDKYGYEPELSWGSPKVTNWRSFSTDDGTNFKVDTIGIGYKEQSNKLVRRIPTPTSYANAFAFGNKMYYQGGYPGQVFGMWQLNAQLYATTDGKNWDSATNNISFANIHKNAVFAFKGKLWSIGGFKNFISTSNISSNIYSTSDGENWTLETSEPIFGKLSGMNVAATDDVIYLFGGEYYNESNKRVLSDKIYRSTDGINWEEVENVSETYTARLNPVIVVKNNEAYIFGRYSEATSDNYAYPVDKNVLFDTYVISLK